MQDVVKAAEGSDASLLLAILALWVALCAGYWFWILRRRALSARKLLDLPVDGLFYVAVLCVGLLLLLSARGGG